MGMTCTLLTGPFASLYKPTSIVTNIIRDMPFGFLGEPAFTEIFSPLVNE
jgi:hypothetical protein